LYSVSVSKWWASYYKLGSKIENQAARPTANDVRKAAILRQVAARGAHAGPSSAIYQAAETMEWVIEYGKADFEARLRAAKAEAGLGTER
jgi:predicted secreted Zn-dependent protease